MVLISSARLPRMFAALDASSSPRGAANVLLIKNTPYEATMKAFMVRFGWMDRSYRAYVQLEYESGPWRSVCRIYVWYGYEGQDVL